MTIRAHLDEQFARQFGGLPQITPPVSPFCEYCGGSGDVHRPDGEWLGECPVCPPVNQHQPGLSVLDCSELLLGNADIEINNWEAINGLCVEELPDGRHD